MTIKKYKKKMFVDPAFRLNAFPTRWWARFLFEKLIFFIDYLKMTWSRHLFFVLFLKGKQNKKEKP